MERIPVSVLLASDGKTCAQITHILKILGNGSMQEGLQNFYAYAEGRGLLQGRLQGAAGMLCASITLYFMRTTLIISKKPGNTGISRDIRTEFTTDLLLSD